MQLPTRASKVLAGVLGIFLTGVVLGVGIYLPNYSTAAKSGEEARRQLRLQGIEHTSGGMWKNLNERSKSAKGNDPEDPAQ